MSRSGFRSHGLGPWVDCENFYVSCERVFDPSLREKPVAVLSNNDGCVTARSEAVKAAGVPMGAPYFELEDALDEMGAVVLSSNYVLYGDVSGRMHSILEKDALALERYSIDEAFLTLPALKRETLQRLADRFRRTIRRQAGVPIRVGVGPTKTLAKIADENAKARKRAGAGRGVYVCPRGPSEKSSSAALRVGAERTSVRRNRSGRGLRIEANLG